MCVCVWVLLSDLAVTSQLDNFTAMLSTLVNGTYTHTVLELGDDFEWRERSMEKTLGNDLKLATARLLKSRGLHGIRPVMPEQRKSGEPRTLCPTTSCAREWTIARRACRTPAAHRRPRW